MKKILELINGFYYWLNTDGLLHISITSMIITFSFPLIMWWSVGLAVLVGLSRKATRNYQFTTLFVIVLASLLLLS